MSLAITLMAVAALQCPQCSVEFVPVVTLGGPEDPGSPGQVAEVLRARGGRYLVSSETMGPLVLVYGADGSLLQTLGRRGTGPGEFMDAVKFAEGEDGFMLSEIRSNRVHIFSRELEHKRTSAAPATVWDLAGLPSGQWQLVATTTGPGDRHVVHRVTSEGGVTGTFLRPEQGGLEALVYRMTVDSHGRSWVVSLNGRVWLLDADGQELAQGNLPGPHLGKSLDIRVSPDEAPPAQVVDVEVAQDGDAWIFVAEPDPDFIPSAFRAQKPASSQLYDGVLYAVRADSGTIVVESVSRFDDLVWGLGQGWAYDLVETPIGDRRVRIGRLVPIS